MNDTCTVPTGQVPGPSCKQNKYCWKYTFLCVGLNMSEINGIEQLLYRHLNNGAINSLITPYDLQLYGI